MQIVVAHHHLNTGGVTQVILNQLRALATLPPVDRPRRVGVLYGGRDDGWPHSWWHQTPPYEFVMMRLPSVDYDEGRWRFRPRPLSDEISTLLADHGFAPDDTLLHVHNHSLGKNVSLPDALRQLAERGFRLLLQIHDFAEDFRPTNYCRLAQALDAWEPHTLSVRLYPQAAGIHYATLTRRDSDVLAAAGVGTDRLHRLPNPVAEFAGLKGYDDVAEPVRDQLGLPRDARLVLYPVRGLRRKNVGELLLHAAVGLPDTWHAISRAPRNPQELAPFERWRKLATELKLRTRFDICGSGELSFLDALAASDALITTSVAEGFGMVFLEAWLAGRPLLGRSLPNLTREFEAAGVDLTGLRDSLEVPFSWLPDKAELAEALDADFRWACEKYGGGPATEDETATALQRMLARSTIDFALLPGRFQEIAIRRAAQEPAATRQELAMCNPGLEAQWTADRHRLAEQIATNAETVRAMYSLDTIGGRLREVYSAVRASPWLGTCEPLPRGESILRHFLQIGRLHAIRFEE